MMKKLGVVVMIISLFLTGCKRDDDNNDLPQSEQNEADDNALVDYLEDHYFDPERGLIKKYDEDDEEDDEYPALMSSAVKLPSGVWIVKREGVVAEGPSVVDNKTDSMLISFNSVRFKASYEQLAEDETAYEKYSANFTNTIYSTGTPAWDPAFYYTKITEAMADKGINESYFVIEGLVEGLKHFNATMTNGNDLYNFQGAILIPSRAAYGRDVVYLNGTLDGTSYRDNSFVFNFEIHRVLTRQ